MPARERKKIEMELSAFTSENFVKPSECRPEGIRLVVQLLSHKIKALRQKFNYVSNAAYLLLPHYYDIQNLLTSTSFRKMHS